MSPRRSAVIIVGDDDKAGHGTTVEQVRAALTGIASDDRVPAASQGPQRPERALRSRTHDRAATGRSRASQRCLTTALLLLPDAVDWAELWRREFNERVARRRALTERATAPHIFAAPQDEQVARPLWIAARLAIGREQFTRRAARTSLGSMYLDREMTEKDLRERLDRHGLRTRRPARENCITTCCRRCRRSTPIEGGARLMELVERDEAGSR